MTTWQLAWRLIRDRPWLALLNTVLAIVVAALDLLPGPIAAAFFDRLTGRGTPGFSAETLIAFLLATALARTVLKTNAVLAATLHEFVAGAIVRRNLFDAILARPDGGRAGPSPGETLGHLRDDAAQAARLVGLLCYGVSAILFTAGALALLLRIDAGLTLLVVLPPVAVVAVARRGFARIERYRQESRRAADRVTGALGEWFEAVQAVQLAGAEPHLIAHFRRLNEERRRLTLRDAVLTRALGAVFANSASLGTGLVLLFAARPLRAGSFTIGDFALFVYYLGSVSEFTRFFGGALASYKGAGVSFGRLIGLLRGAGAETLVAPGPLHLTGPLPRIEPPPRRESDRLVRFEAVGLTYRHPGSGRGIEEINLRLRAGEVVAIAGRVGAGKTTLLRALLGQLPAEAGEIRWNGGRVADPATWCVPPRVAYTPQVPRLFSETLRDNILLGLPADEAALTVAVRGAALERDIAALEGVSRRSSGRAARGSPAGRRSGPPPRGCWRAGRSCLCSTTSPARSTWRRSACCGTVSSNNPA